MAMITRRAAEAFDRALDASEDPRAYARLNVRDQQLVATVRAVRGLAPSGYTFDADSEFREQLRLRLMAEAEGLAAVRASRPVGSGKREAPRVVTLGRGRRILAGTVATVLIGGTATAVVSSTAMPGDLLYPVKRGLEEARLATSTSDLARGDTQLALARTRLEEAEVLASRDGAPGAYGELDEATAERLGEALREFDASATRGTQLLLNDYAERGDPASLAKVDQFLQETLPRLQRLEPELPAELHPLVEQLLARLGDVAQQVTQTASACGSECTNLGIGGAGLVAALEQSGVALDAAGRAGGTSGLPLPLEPGAGSGAGGVLDGGDGAAAPGGPAAGSVGVQLDLPRLSVGGDGSGDGGVAGSGDRIKVGGGGATVAPLPGVGATADLPEVGVGGGQIDGRLPLPGVTVRSETVSLPAVSVSVPLLPGGSNSSTSSTTSPASSSSTTKASSDGTCIDLVLKICLD
jgi:hypothetical protein